MSDNKFKVVNTSALKTDAMGLSMGKPVFVDDFESQFPDLLEIRFLYSPIAHGKIKSIDTSEAEKLPGVELVLTHKNTPRVPHTTAGQGYPEPSPYDTYMFPRKVRFEGDRVAAVAAESVEIAETAIKLIKVEYEELPAIFNAKQAQESGAPIIHDEDDCFMPIPVPYHPEKNLCAKVDAEAGDMQKGFDEADFVIEREYSSHYAQHCPLEPHKVISYPDPLQPTERIVIMTSTQVPFHVRRICAQVLGIPAGKIRVIKPRVGGAFGTKQEIYIEYVSAYVTQQTGRASRISLTRPEELIYSRTRHPQDVRLKAGFNKDGKIHTIFMEVLSNTGAYGSHALTVMCNCGSKTLPLYRFKNIQFKGRTVYTNMPVGGAYRGYGATQAAFALESIVDEIAKELDMDPIELRKKNHISSGDTSPIFAALGEGKEGVPQTVESCGIKECLEIGMKEIDWKNKHNNTERDTARYKYGVGMALLMQGSSVPEIDMGSAYMKINDDGSFNLNVGATDLGTGSDTVLAQIACEVLDCSMDKIIVHSSDTDMTPFDVGAYASSTTYLSGSAVLKVAKKIKKQILDVVRAMSKETGEDDDFMIQDSTVTTPLGKKITYKDIALYTLYAKDQFQIAANASHITHKSPPPFSAHFADIRVDTVTGQIKVLKYVATVDCGTAINPALAEGQTEGAMLNGLSFALTERFIFNEKGKVVNNDFGSYKIFSTMDIPEMKAILVPTYEETGPFGAKSVSEISINGAIPSIANALYDSVKIRLRHAPFTPDKVLAALKKVK